MVQKLTDVPIEFIFSPAWWNKQYGITFEKDFFFHPKLRVERERQMRQALYDRFGDLGMGEKNAIARPVIGPVHLAAGYFVSKLLGCEVMYHDNAPPDVIPANLSDSEIEMLTPPDFSSNSDFLELTTLIETLETSFGYVEGDIDWSGILNLALDLRGQEIFIDLYENPELANHLFSVIQQTLVKFVTIIRAKTGTSSCTVNPFVKHFRPSINLHSNCSLTMISAQMYEEHLLQHEMALAAALPPFGIHYCGCDMEKMAVPFSKIDNVKYFDVGYGSNISVCRQILPDAYFNLRLSPSKMLTQTATQVEDEVYNLFKQNGGCQNAGLCCINMDDGTPDENIRAVFSAVNRLKKNQILK